MTTAKISDRPTQTALQIAASLNLMMCAPRWASRSIDNMMTTTAANAAQAQMGTVTGGPRLEEGLHGLSGRTVRLLHCAYFGAADPRHFQAVSGVIYCR